MAEPEADKSTGIEATEKPGKSAGKPRITVKVYAPFHVYYEGEALSLSAVNEVGPFDVLPGHHNFLCMLIPSEIKIEKPDNTAKKVSINRALLHVHDNHVTVFVDV